MALCWIGTTKSPFNSRPHKEVDTILDAEIRAHDPFNSRPHKEVDHNVVRFTKPSLSFNSRPHKEVDAVSHIV